MRALIIVLIVVMISSCGGSSGCRSGYHMYKADGSSEYLGGSKGQKTDFHHITIAKREGAVLLTRGCDTLYYSPVRKLDDLH